MRTLQVLHSTRLAVLLGSALLCVLGFVAGCDDGSTTVKLDPVANKATEEEQTKARTAAYGKAGYQAKVVKTAPKR